MKIHFISIYEMSFVFLISQSLCWEDIKHTIFINLYEMKISVKFEFFLSHVIP